MRVVGIIRDDEDLADPKQQWIAYGRAYVAENIAGPAHLEGLAGGLVVPEVDEYNLASILPLESVPAGAWKPWESGRLPPSFSPMAFITTARVGRPAVDPSRIAQLPWFEPPPPGAVALFDLAAPPSVQQLNPLEDPRSSSIGPSLEDLEQHVRASTGRTLAAWKVDPVLRDALGVSMTQAAGMLTRGAEIAWFRSKAVFEVDGRIVSPVDHRWNLYDLYKFGKWVGDHMPDLKPMVPRCLYNPTSHFLECRFKDGKVVTKPSWKHRNFVNYRF